MVQATRPLNGRYLTVMDAEKHAVLAYDVHKAPTRVISIENTNSGTIIPLAELQRLHSCEFFLISNFWNPCQRHKHASSGRIRCGDAFDLL